MSKPVTKTVLTNAGLLEYSDTLEGAFVRLNTGPWRRFDGPAYEMVINLGGGWYYLTQFWNGYEGLPVEIPFKCVPARILA